MSTETRYAAVWLRLRRLNEVFFDSLQLRRPSVMPEITAVEVERLLEAERNLETAISQLRQCTRHRCGTPFDYSLPITAAPVDDQGDQADPIDRY